VRRERGKEPARDVGFLTVKNRLRACRGSVHAKAGKRKGWQDPPTKERLGEVTTPEGRDLEFATYSEGWEGDGE